MSNLKFIVDKEVGVKDDMTVGFVLINTAPTREHEVYNKLRRVPKVVELHPLFGEYDLIAKIESDSLDKVGDIVLNQIRSISGVIDTKTLTGTKF